MQIYTNLSIGLSIQIIGKVSHLNFSLTIHTLTPPLISPSSPSLPPQHFHTPHKLTHSYAHSPSPLLTHPHCDSFLLQLSPLPKYTQLRVSVNSYLPATGHIGSGINNITDHGHSSLFVLTDVATVSMLSTLYNMPTGTFSA